MNKICKIGVMGCANIAIRSIIPAIEELKDNYSLVAVSSRDKDKALSCADRFKCEAIVGYDELLNRDDIDAIYIPLPTGLHLEWIIKTITAGKHVYAEKSIAKSHEDAIEMVNLAKEKNIVLMEGYMFQYHSQHSITLELINNGEIGEIRNFRSSFGFPPLEKNNFRYNDKIGGGALLDAAGYPVRATYFILGDSFKVAGANLFFDKNRGTNIFGNAILNGENGVSSQIAFGFDNYYQCNYELWGSKGKITAERAFTPQPDFNPTIVLENKKGTNRLVADCDNHFRNAFTEFYNAIYSDKKEKFYKEILQQSRALSDIKEYGSQQINCHK